MHKPSHGNAHQRIPRVAKRRTRQHDSLDSTGEEGAFKERIPRIVEPRSTFFSPSWSLSFARSCIKDLPSVVPGTTMNYRWYIPKHPSTKFFLNNFFAGFLDSFPR
jgi:hypothetical protein